MTDSATRAWERIPRPGAWVLRARCRGLEPAAADRIFFPSDTSKPTIDYVGVFCNPCPVRSECVAFAREHHPRGVWGGESEAERSTVLGRRADGRDLERKRERESAPEHGLRRRAAMSPERRERKNAYDRAYRTRLREAS